MLSCLIKYRSDELVVRVVKPVVSGDNGTSARTYGASSDVECFHMAESSGQVPQQPCRKAVLTPRRVRRIRNSLADIMLNDVPPTMRSLWPFLD